MRLLAESKIETGLRWGELTELRVRDIEFPTRMLTVSRAVVEVNAKFHPAGGRFLVKDYPKDGEYRWLKLTSQIAGKLRPYAHERGLSDDDLVFAMPERGPVLKMLPNPDRLGRTVPSAAGRIYGHGTLSAYTAGRCRCEHCKRAFAQYRPQRRRPVWMTPVPLPRSHRAQPEAASCQWGETGAASLRRSTGPMSCKWSMPAGVRRWRSPAASQATGAALSPAATFPPGCSLLDDGPGIATARPEGRDLWPWRWGPLALNGPLVAALKVVARGPRERCPRRAVFHKRAIDPGRVPGVMSPSGSRGDREGENG